MNERRLLTAREVAERLGISTGALLRWSRAGKVPAHKLPSGAIRYVPEEIDAWLAENQMGAAERGVLATRTDRARPGAYGTTVSSSSLATRPREAVENEEDEDAR